jgi:hypothetical protein
MDRPIFHGEVINILDHRRETLLVDVTRNPVPGQRAVVIDLRLVTDDEHMEGSWPVGTFCPANALALAEQLWSAAAIAELLDEEARAGVTGIRRLPVIHVCGTAFFVDERLRQLRAVDDPGHYFDLDGPG